ncbi:uncharacterized protein [Branchiostoma lanceolatum]|uniref:uncharacterized protein n=1 Tax=Branchiostoma lanceolatum TaxID=7740 RepID=UPI00345230CB
MSWKDDVWRPDSSEIPGGRERDASVDESPRARDDLTSPEENRRRRKLVLNRIRGEPFGFELQTYGIHHSGWQELELCTYVSRVHDDSPAFYCGLTPGDVILSVNDVDVAHADHQVIVQYIREAGDKLVLIVLFENCIKKVELEVKLLKTKRLLFNRELELRALVMKEKQILKGVTLTTGARNRECSGDVTSLGSSTRSERNLHCSADSMEMFDSFTQMSFHGPDHDDSQSSSMPSNQPKLAHVTQHKCEDASSLKRSRYECHHMEDRPLAYSRGTQLSRMTSVVDPNSSGRFPDRFTLHHVPSTQPDKKEPHATLASSQRAAFRRSQSASGHTMNIRETKIGSTSVGFTSKSRTSLPVSFRRTSLPTPNVTAPKTLFQSPPRALDWTNRMKVGNITAVRPFPHRRSCSSISNSSTTGHIGSSISTLVTKDSPHRPPMYSSMERLEDYSVDQPSIDSYEMSGNFSLSMVPGLESPSDEISSL